MASDSLQRGRARKGKSKLAPTYVTSLSVVEQRQLAASVYSTAWSLPASCITRRSSPGSRLSPASRSSHASRSSPASRLSPARRSTPAIRSTPARRSSTIRRLSPTSRSSAVVRYTPPRRISSARRMSPASRSPAVRRSTLIKRPSSAKRIWPTSRSSTNRGTPPAGLSSLTRRLTSTTRPTPAKSSSPARRSSPTKRTSPAIPELESATKQGTGRCRIPQRLSNGAKPPSNSISIPKARASYEPATRPKSANRLKEEFYNNRTKYSTPRLAKPNERVTPTAKKPSALPRKAVQRPIIMVPMTQLQTKTPTKAMAKIQYNHPDQEAMKRDEDIDQQLSQISPVGSFDQRSDRESITSRAERLVELKIIWQDKIVQFENMKGDLKQQQRNILTLYAKMRDTHQKMAALGETANLPPAEDLRIMNVANMTPEQLLQLCAGDDTKDHRWNGVQTLQTIDLNKLYEMPSKLVITCEQTLIKRKEIIDWFESLTSNEKGISVHILLKKINEFNAENDMLKCSLDDSKSHFLKELEEIVSFMRKNVNETMALQLRIEELTLEMSELNSHNADLRKQLHNADHMRSQISRNRVEELEKELKDEKCKRLFMRDRLSRSEGQVKINVERATQLEATLEQARSQIWSLERTVQQLHEQNQKLQSDFDKELGKLTDSIREHTVHLEEIAEAREKLQSEKEDLEKRLTELSAYYNESLHNMKKELASSVAKLIETEKKSEEQQDENKKLDVKLEVVCNQLLESELRYKNILQELHEKEDLFDKSMETHRELESTKNKLEEANSIICENKSRLSKQSDTIKEIERNFKEAENSAESLKSEMVTKNEYIVALENKNVLLEQQLQENENKMEAYVEQLSSLKAHINQLQEDFGEFENLKELHVMLNNQRAKLLEATRQNGELAEALQKKDKELEQYNDSLSEHEQLLLEREGIIKMLSEKEEEQSNILKILKNNLELRSQAENHLSQQIMEKNTEIESLLVNLGTRKQQISNMEKIILTLEDQTRKASLQRKKDQEHIISLQKKIAEQEALQLEASRNVDSPENLDSLIKILEDELGASIEHELGSKDYNQNIVSQKKYHGDRKRDKLECHDNVRSRYPPESDAYPTKHVMGNYTKKLFNDGSEEQYMGDNLDRKKAITNIDTQRWSSSLEQSFNVQAAAIAKENARRSIPNPPQNLFSRNLQYPNPDQQKGDRKYKMFKIAGHRM